MAKKLYIKTYGCQMNVYDSGRMTDVLAPLGYESATEPDDADMVILNTCHIREKAAEKVYSELGRLRLLREKKQARGDDMILAVAGCVAQAEGDEILARAPYVDMVFGPQAYHKLPEMVARASRASGAVLETDFPTEDKFDQLPQASADSVAIEGRSAFLTVQEGCDKFCAFCVVPYTRGSEYSRPAADVIVEAQRLVDLGVTELTLLGQNVNNYHGHDKGLGGLIAALADMDGIERLRYTTSYPAEMDDTLIAAHGDIPELMPFLHLPVQSGSDRVLKAMNRRHSSGDYRQLVQRLRDARPDIALSSDFIVGFPGESESDFEDTLELVREINFVQAYSFKYSPRPGTPAAGSDEQIEEAVKDERLARLQALLGEQQSAFNKSCVDSVMPVLLDRPGRHLGQMVGRSPYMQPVHVTAPDDLFGKIIDLKIDDASGNSLTASLVKGIAA
ncbi:MAG: tRNA (N6-isopentenyl adenosine(37)-C2)-methylthiotransferase MiaB [Rhodospirillaceae bacterium]|nr:tRNA (N6-isopentenyl adenosine(37)-C2)-methylthiotransferase MiaB [Rhodospirillaceae bacterium]MBT4218845.1 tRNA (N6-isopentenyl adenosine(37)-C2)-methylthiotransferase MiaB [Rhodospirillaceae bacterium]MBT4463848.1 tRNA (N6-isopentenyl adenosine(37)-C2)-methylthiotransferase MiaB [Rhodospirillaceae bacterium]MBT5012950.1 tRNA (N6-isopentenyl adenosine(37)-C2)-methylthiotransferase MiaB [Rhodospirillaceae bacterium]MBT5308498.1 tRNA (N6-isopentenyl adenosine(37)-C2)-methylthiotransferase Mia